MHIPLVWFRKGALQIGAAVAALIVTGNGGVLSGEKGIFTTLGIYHWGGQAARGVSEGVTRIAGIGGTAVRITLSPLYTTDYNISGGCYQDFTLTNIAHIPDIRNALGNVKIRVMMLTAYDGTSFGDCRTKNYLNPSFYTRANIAAMRKEYSDFAFHLHKTCRNTGKRFIISSWEGDNELYCGQAHRYATDAHFRNFCNANYASLYNGTASVSDSICAMKKWLAVRRQGIRDGRSRAALDGYRGVEVLFAPEFNIVRALKDNGLKSILYDILPFVSYDYVSYSSHESINRADPAMEIIADLNRIRKVIGSKHIIVGEFGCTRSAWGNAVVDRIRAVHEASRAWGVPYVFHWNLYDQNAVDTFGLYDVRGAKTAIGEYYENMFRSQKCNPKTHSRKD